MNEPTAPTLEAEEDYTVEQQKQRLLDGARELQAELDRRGVGRPEEQPAEEQGIDALAQVVLTFLPDGGLHMKALGDLRPTIAWAMGEFMRSVGDDMFAKARAQAEEALAAKQPRIVVPQGGMTRIPR
jgi:hypothetical protein